jgi:hypothetical protein
LLTLLAVAASFVGVWIAQKNFNTDQRPIMWIGNVDRPSYNSGGVDWNFDLVNAGKSPARNVRYDLVIGVDSGTDQHQPRENWKYIAIVMPGMPNERDGSQPARVTAHTPGEPYTTERFAQAARTPGSIKVGGIVEYEGIGGHYRTTFCFANDVSNPAGALHYQYVTQAECTNDVQ